MNFKNAYVSPEVMKIEVSNADVVTDSGLETPSITLPWPTPSNQTPSVGDWPYDGFLVGVNFLFWETIFLFLRKRRALGARRSARLSRGDSLDEKTKNVKKLVFLRKSQKIKEFFAWLSKLSIFQFYILWYNYKETNVFRRESGLPSPPQDLLLNSAKCQRDTGRRSLRASFCNAS